MIFIASFLILVLGILGSLSWFPPFPHFHFHKLVYLDVSFHAHNTRTRTRTLAHSTLDTLHKRLFLSLHYSMKKSRYPP